MPALKVAFVRAGDPASDELRRARSGISHRGQLQGGGSHRAGVGSRCARRGCHTKPRFQACVGGTVGAGNERFEHVGVEPLKCESAISASGNHLRSDERWDDSHGSGAQFVGVGGPSTVRAKTIHPRGGGAASSDVS